LETLVIAGFVRGLAVHGRRGGPGRRVEPAGDAVQVERFSCANRSATSSTPAGRRYLRQPRPFGDYLLDQLLILITGLLVLAVIIALLGIGLAAAALTATNTLAVPVGQLAVYLLVAVAAAVRAAAAPARRAARMDILGAASPPATPPVRGWTRQPTPARPHPSQDPSTMDGRLSTRAAEPIEVETIQRGVGAAAASWHDHQIVCPL
jgi:hypothetical protein